MNNLVIHWFRQDLRVEDNVSLYEASKTGNKILPIYILDEIHNKNKIGNASKVWLYHSLDALNKLLNGNIYFSKGDPMIILIQLIKTLPIKAVFWNRCYELWRIKRDQIIIKQLSMMNNIIVKTFNSSLLWEPWTIKKSDNSHYKKFNFFKKKILIQINEPRKPITLDNTLNLYTYKKLNILESLNLLNKNNSHNNILKYWKITPKNANNKLQHFIKNKLNNYQDKRNLLSEDSTSKLSPYLHYGQISPNKIFYTLKSMMINYNHNAFFSEIVWREFSYYLMFYYPYLYNKNIISAYDNCTFSNNMKLFNAWKKGNTGVPIVDAGIREMLETGYMHNRTRMIVSSFLIKNLSVNWTYGANFFLDYLVDADIANNSTSWQWIFGSSFDNPYFRIFNPILQTKKFDPNCNYIRKYIPEIKSLPNEYLYNPWKINNINYLKNINYPKPIIINYTKSRLSFLKNMQIIHQS